jgi:glycosyltransferase involved in cell wall biosynthesis
MIGWEFPPFMSGGLATHCYFLTRELSKLGVQIDFYMPATQYKIQSNWMNIIPVDYSSFDGLASKVYGGYFLRKVNQKRVQTQIQIQENLDFFGRINKFNELVSELLALNNEIQPYALIHGHDWITSKGSVAAKHKTILPYIMTVHSTEYDRTANLSPWQWILDIEKQGVNNADGIIAVSELTKKELTEKYGVKDKKIKVIYNGIEEELFKETARKEVLGFDGDKKIVLYNGRLSIMKGPEFFLRAARKVIEKDEKVYFIISGNGDMLEKLVEMTYDLGIADHVKFLGFTPPEKIPLLYAASDVYVLPSVVEPFGITVLEAIASNTPVITSKTSGVSEVVKNCLRVDFWDEDEMAKQILAVLNYSSLKEDLKENMRKDLQELSWKKVAEKTVDFYKEVSEK